MKGITKISLVLFITSLIVVFSYFLIPVNALTNISSCQDLNTANEVYTLINNISSAGTCLTINANNIIVDGNGFWINYSQQSSGYGINNSGRFKNITIKNFNLIQGNKTVSDSTAIYFLGNTLNDIRNISNNNIWTFGSMSHGILDQSTEGDYIANNNITVSGVNSYGIYTFNFYSGNITNNNITSSDRALVLYYHGADSSTISNNNINVFGSIDTTTDRYGIWLSTTTSAKVLNNQIITNALSGGSDYGIYIDNSDSNTISNNNISTYTSDSNGIYISYSDSNIIQNNNITTSGSSSYGIISSVSNSATIVNNIVKVLGSSTYGIVLSSSNSNNITGGSIISQQSYDYFLTGASTTNNFTNTNFTVQRRIWFNDATSWFNYNNQTNENIWLKTKVSALSSINRILVNWNNTNMIWNDSTSVALTANYNLTGLNANTIYKIYNQTPSTQTNPYNIITDANGALNFTIVLGLNVNTQIKVNYTPSLSWSANSTSIPSPATYNPSSNYGFQINSTSSSGMNNTFFQLGRPTGALNNYTALNNSASGKDVWYYNLTQSALGAVGTYNYTWFLNDTNNLQNKSNTVNYIINQNTTNPINLWFRNATNQYLNQNMTAFYGTLTNTTLMSVYLQSGIFNLYYNSLLNNTLNNTLQTLAVGIYNITGNTSGNQNYTANSTSWSIIVNNHIPQWSTNTTSPNSPQTYNSSNSYGFQINWTDANSDLKNTSFQLGRPTGILTNYTALNNSASGKDVWYYNFTQSSIGSVGTYNYTWFGIDTQGMQNKSDTVNYVISSNVLNVTLSPTNQTIIYGTLLTQYCLDNSTSLGFKCSLFLNNINITDRNNTNQIYGIGIQSFKANISNIDNINYTWSQQNTNVTVNKAPLQLIVSPQTSTIIYGISTPQYCWTNITGVNCNIYRNSSLITNNTAEILRVDVYNITANITDTANYTIFQNSSLYTVSKAATKTILLLNGTDSDQSYNQNNMINITGTINITGFTVNLDLNETGYGTNYKSGTTSITNITSFGSIKTYNVTAHYDGNENYTSSYSSHIIQITPDGALTYSNIKNSIASNSPYIISQNYSFNITWSWVTNAPSYVLFEFNNTNYTVNTNVTVGNSAEFYKNLTGDLKAGMYSYLWYANDTVNVWVKTTTQSYIVAQANPTANMTLTSSLGWSIYQGDTTSILGNNTNLGSNDCNYNLYRDGTSVLNPYNVAPAVGSFVFLYNTTGCLNYTPGSVQNILDVLTPVPTVTGGGGGQIIITPPISNVTSFELSDKQIYQNINSKITLVNFRIKNLLNNKIAINIQPNKNLTSYIGVYYNITSSDILQKTGTKFVFSDKNNKDYSFDIQAGQTVPITLYFSDVNDSTNIGFTVKDTVYNKIDTIEISLIMYPQIISLILQRLMYPLNIGQSTTFTITSNGINIPAINTAVNLSIPVGWLGVIIGWFILFKVQDYIIPKMSKKKINTNLLYISSTVIIALLLVFL